jgi:PAS domain S-box-containing protein
VISYLATIEFFIASTDSLEQAKNFIKLGSLWPLLISLQIHFLISFVKSKAFVKHPFLYGLIYIPSIVFITLGFFTNIMDPLPIKVSWGWTFGSPENIYANIVMISWASIISILFIIVAIRHFRKATNPLLKKQVFTVALAIMLPSLVFIARFALMGIDIITPDISTVFFVLGSVFITLSIWRHNLFALKPDVMAKNIIRIVNDIVLVVDMENNIVTTNPAIQKFLKHSIPDIVGESIFDFISPKYLGDFKNNMKKILNKEKILLDEELELLDKFGKPILFSISCVYLELEKNIVYGAVLIARDIRVRKETETQIKDYSKELEKKNKELEKALDLIIGREVAMREMKIKMKEKK